MQTIDNCYKILDYVVYKKDENQYTSKRISSLTEI